MPSLMSAISAAASDYSEPAADTPVRVVNASADQLYAARIAGRVEGANAERQRLREIFASPAAQRLPDLAVSFAFASDASAKHVIGMLERQTAAAAPATTVASIDIASIYASRQQQISGVTLAAEPEANGSFIDEVYARRAREARGER